MKKWLILAATAALAAALAGCSAGGATCTTNCGGSVSPTAADLIVTVDKATILNAGNDAATVTVTAVDANRNVIANVPVTIVPDSGAVVTASASVTSATGVVTGAVSIGSDDTTRQITVVATSGSLTKSTILTVKGTVLQTLVAQSVLAPGATGSITYTLVDANNNPMVGVPISVSGTGLPTTQGITNANGQYPFSFTAPATEQTLTITGTSGLSSVASTIDVKSSGTIPVASGTPQAYSLAANPSNVPVNTDGSTANYVNVRALFVGADNTPISGVRVIFDLAGDVNSIGGTISSGSSIVYSDAAGVARTTYYPGARGSGNKALTIRGCWDINDFTPVAGTAACPNGHPISTTITVVDSGVSLAPFTNGLVTSLDAQSVYQLDFAVQVVDSVGQPKSGVTVKGSVDLPTYYKGQYFITATATASAWVSTRTASCPNEDVNRNNVVEVLGGVSEDANSSGRLEPYSADAAIIPASAGSDVTDVSGKAYFHLQYGQNVASWDDYVLTFSAIVAGTEGRATYTDQLPIPATVANNIAALPPFYKSPYGVLPSSGVGQRQPVTDPVSGVQYLLCVVKG